MRIAEGFGSDNMENVEMEFTLDQEVEGNIAAFVEAAHLSGNGHLVPDCDLTVYPSGIIKFGIYGSSGEDVLLLQDAMKELSNVETRIQKEQLYINFFIG